jgi:hypothetical protein
MTLTARPTQTYPRRHGSRRSTGDPQ